MSIRGPKISHPVVLLPFIRSAHIFGTSTWPSRGMWGCDFQPKNGKLRRNDRSFSPCLRTSYPHLSPSCTARPASTTEVNAFLSLPDPIPDFTQSKGQRGGGIGPAPSASCSFYNLVSSSLCSSITGLLDIQLPTQGLCICCSLSGTPFLQMSARWDPLFNITLSERRSLSIRSGGPFLPSPPPFQLYFLTAPVASNTCLLFIHLSPTRL